MAEVDEVAGRWEVLMMELRSASGVHFEGTRRLMMDVKLRDFFSKGYNFLTTLCLTSEQLYVLYFNLLSQML